MTATENTFSPAGFASGVAADVPGADPPVVLLEPVDVVDVEEQAIPASPRATVVSTAGKTRRVVRNAWCNGDLGFVDNREEVDESNKAVPSLGLAE